MKIRGEELEDLDSFGILDPVYLDAQPAVDRAEAKRLRNQAKVLRSKGKGPEATKLEEQAKKLVQKAKEFEEYKAAKSLKEEIEIEPLAFVSGTNLLSEEKMPWDLAWLEQMRKEEREWEIFRAFPGSQALDEYKASMEFDAASKFFLESTEWTGPRPPTAKSSGSSSDRKLPDTLTGDGAGDQRAQKARSYASVTFERLNNARKEKKFVKVIKRREGWTGYYPDGVHVQVYTSGKREGTMWWEFLGGGTLTILKNGTVRTDSPNGPRVIKKPDGTTTTEINGTITTIDKDGTKRITPPNGSQETIPLKGRRLFIDTEGRVGVRLIFSE